MKIENIALKAIKRPLPRGNDPEKVLALKDSIEKIGVQEPIEVLEVNGQYYGFSGCHRYEACQRLG
ncbi:MAG: ParB N-terminal domain-containing protein, partial [Microcoleaceae cyanobacterium]